MGRTPGLAVVATVLGAAVVVGCAFAISWARDDGTFVAVAVFASFVLAPLVLVVPAFVGMRREQSIVRNGTRLRARVTACDPVGRTGNAMRYAVARVSLRVERPDGDPVDATVRRVIYGVDRRDIGTLVGRHVWVYWHPATPSLAVPEAIL